MDCSIIINTYNRAPYLRRLLAGLERLHGPPFEIVVVNGPSTDGTQAVLEHYAGRVKHVRCPERNLSHSRNLGIAAAAGELVVFIDDDALPGDEQWLERFRLAFVADTTGRLGALGGPVWHRDTERAEFDGGRTSDYGLQVFERGSTTKTRRHEGHEELSDLRAFAPSRSGAPDGARWVTGVPGGNCAIRRSALVQIGGFDEFFVYYLDETDVCFRLARAGYQIGYLPDNGIRHYAARSAVPGRALLRDWRTIARSDTYFAMQTGADPLPRRALKTLAAAPRKHFAGEILGSLPRGQVSPPDWLRMVAGWGRGVAEGFAAGLHGARQFGAFTTAPAPLLPFRAPPPAERRLRIALLSQALPEQPGSGGIGRYTFDLARGLHERGHEVHLFHKSEQPLRRYSLGWQAHGIPPAEYTVPHGHPHPVLERNLRYGLAVLRRLAALHAQAPFDIVHASNWDAEAAAIIRAGVLPTVLMLVSPLAQVIDTEQWPLTDDLRACVTLDAWQIANAGAVCAPSSGVLAAYRALMDLDEATLARVRFTPLGIDPLAEPHSFSHQPGEAKRLLFVGRLERRKGIHTLLAVLPELLRAFPQWECHLVGNDAVPLTEGGTPKQRFLAEHRGAPWLGRVVFHGQVDDDALQRHYQACDLFVAPSLFESFGLIYHEAMQYGKAVVGCRTGGVPEVVADGVEGVLVAPDCPPELHAALARLMGDETLRHALGAAGMRRVQQGQNYRTMAAALEQVYSETIARGGTLKR
jgi:glycogen synthase